jgi:hypothetical protein
MGQYIEMSTFNTQVIRYEWNNRYSCKEIGFWTLSIVRIFNKLNTWCFGDWICLRPQVKGGEKKEKNPYPGPAIEISSLSKGPNINIIIVIVIIVVAVGKP